MRFGTIGLVAALVLAAGCAQAAKPPAASAVPDPALLAFIGESTTQPDDLWMILDPVALRPRFGTEKGDKPLGKETKP